MGVPKNSLLNFKGGITGRIAAGGRGLAGTPIHTFGKGGRYAPTGVLFTLDASGVIARLKKHGADLDRKLKEAQERAGEALLNHVSPRVPVETGALVNSGRVYETALGDTAVRANIGSPTITVGGETRRTRGWAREEGVTDAGVYVADLPYLSEQAGDGVSIGEDITLGEAASSGIYDVRIGWETSYASHVYHDMKARHGAELEPPVGPKDAQQRAKWMEAPGGGEDQELNGLVLSIYSQAVQNAIAGIGSVGGGGQLAKLASRQKTAAVRAASPQRAKQALAAKLKRYGLAVNPNGGYMPAWMSK